LTAAQLHLAMPVTEAAVVIDYAEASSGREEDFSAVIRWFEQEAEANVAPPAA
jgi:hypothetical protein